MTKPTALERFQSLTRARRGDTVVVIADEAELLSIIGDAQVSEAGLIQQQRPGSTIQVVVNDPPPPAAMAIAFDRRFRAAQRPPGM